MAPSGVAFSTRERGIAQGSSAVNAMKITNRYVAFGQRPATREALGRRALPRSQGEHALATRFGVDFSTGDAASGRKARGGVLELTLGCGSRAQSQRAGGNRGKRKSRRRFRSNAACSNAPRERCVALLFTQIFAPFCSTEFLGGRGVGSLSRNYIVPQLGFCEDFFYS